MPTTTGMGNPKWTRDETLLALDLLHRHGKPIDRSHADIVELSELLKSANLYPPERRKPSFRNPDGVALKLQNLMSAIDPSRGLSSSKMDRLVVGEFPRNRKSELAVVAKAIRASISEQSVEPTVDDDEIEFVEGKELTVRHRKRDRRLRLQLLKQRRVAGFKCEICFRGTPPNAPAVAESLFEAHHNVPLATAEGETRTKVSDMALVCACCHRFIHRLIAEERRWVGIVEAAQRRTELLFEIGEI